MENLIELLDRFKQLLKWAPFIPIIVVIVGGVVYTLLGCGEYRREQHNYDDGEYSIKNVFWDDEENK